MTAILAFLAEPQADTGMDLIDHFLAGLPATIGAITALAIATKSLRHNSEIRDQVSNDNDTNMRDDIDRLMNVVSRIDERTVRIGAEQHRDRDARRSGDMRLADQLAKLDVRLDRQGEIARRHHPEEM